MGDIMTSIELRKTLISGYLVFVLVLTGFIGIYSFDTMVHDGVVEAATIVVDAGGNGNYSKIQDAIDNASVGDTIYIWDGIYFENIVIDKSITLLGEGREMIPGYTILISLGIIIFTSLGLIFNIKRRKGFLNLT